ncbi:MAG TPA: MBL fold metallo-hydrolase [Clostridiaceae bacterium]|nr:MBL fold metallo-hydrolase [Clostridiaceae bacterium]
MKFLHYIPGFRTHTKWKMIIATLYYLFTLLLFIADRSIGLFFLAVPFCILSFADLIQHKKKSVSLLKAGLSFVLSLMLLIISISSFPDYTSLRSGSSRNDAITTKTDTVNKEESKSNGTNTKNEQNVIDKETIENIKENTNEDVEEYTNEDIEEDTNENINERQNIDSQETFAEKGELKVHFLDVGQADCIFVQAPNKSMLIDAGNNADSSFILSYLKDLKISKIDVLIGTHPHEDHIGSMDSIIDSFDISSVYMPRISTTTKTFEDVLLSIKNKGLKVTTAKAGVTFDLGEDVRVEIIAPNSDNYEDINNYSAVIKLTYGETSFLFTGDAETVSEKEMISKGYNLKADVLKVGHHGSTSSTSPAFLKAVSPKYAVISVGKDNQYGHPDSIIINRLSTFGVQIYRTDESGTIIAVTDGKKITFDKMASPNKPQAPPAESEKQTTNEIIKVQKEDEEIKEQKDNEKKDVTVYITKSGEKYHSAECQYLSESRIPIKLSEAKAKGYTPCSRCNPPK